MPRLVRSLTASILTTLVVAAASKAITAALKVALNRNPKAAVR